MPRMIGGDVAARLQADTICKSTPIVFFSASVGRKWVQEHEGVVGGFPFIAKPASVSEVIDCIEQHLTNISSRDRSEESHAATSSSTRDLLPPHAS
jgi:FixJ family two-component response regulator